MTSQLAPPELPDDVLDAVVRQEGGEAMTAYVARHTNRATRSEMDARRTQIAWLAKEHGPCSVRHLFYLSVVHGVPRITKNESGYDKVQRAVLELRRRGEIPYRLIVDNTRWRRQAATWDSPSDILNHVAATYRRDLWTGSEYRPEVWCESDSIAGTIAAICNRWAVPLFVCRGQSSETFAHSAVEEWATDLSRKPVVLYVGDHDPAGLECERSLVEKLERFHRQAVELYRVAVTWEQVEAGNLTGTKPKKSYGFPRGVEAEAMPPQELIALVDHAISGYADAHRLRSLEAAERSEREILLRLAGEVA